MANQVATTKGLGHSVLTIKTLFIWMGLFLLPSLIYPFAYLAVQSLRLPWFDCEDVAAWEIGILSEAGIPYQGMYGYDPVTKKGHTWVDIVLPTGRLTLNWGLPHSGFHYGKTRPMYMPEIARIIKEDMPHD